MDVWLRWFGGANGGRGLSPGWVIGFQKRFTDCHSTILSTWIGAGGGTDYTGFCEEREAFAAVGIRPAMYPKGKNCKNMTDVVGGYGSH